MWVSLLAPYYKDHSISGITSNNLQRVHSARTLLYQLQREGTLNKCIIKCLFEIQNRTTLRGGQNKNIHVRDLVKNVPSISTTYQELVSPIL